MEGQPVILIGEGPAADAKARLLERAGARILTDEGEAARLAIVANGDEQAATWLQARGLLVNVVDRPELCDFTLPAIVDRDPVLVAIGTGGTSAGLAAALRQRLETLLPAGLGRLAKALFAGRGSLRARFPAMDERRQAIATLLGPGGALDLLTTHDHPERAIERAELPAAQIERIELGSSDPELLTLRTARLLGIADQLYVEGPVPEPILARARADAVRREGIPAADSVSGVVVHLIWRPQ